MIIKCLDVQPRIDPPCDLGISCDMVTSLYANHVSFEGETVAVFVEQIMKCFNLTTPECKNILQSQSRLYQETCMMVNVAHCHSEVGSEKGVVGDVRHFLHNENCNDQQP